MRVQSFQEMLIEYKGYAGYNPEYPGYDLEDNAKREKLLVSYPHTVIVEGGFLEFDSLEKWIKQHIDQRSVQQLWYGKTGYNFGFTELFFTHEDLAFKLLQAVPNVYTVYPHAYPTGKISRSAGYDEEVDYDPADLNAILYKE